MFEKITTNLQIRKLIINNYNMSTFIIYTFVNFKINNIIRFYCVIFISTYTIITILFKT